MLQAVTRAVAIALAASLVAGCGATLRPEAPSPADLAAAEPQVPVTQAETPASAEALTTPEVPAAPETPTAPKTPTAPETPTAPDTPAAVTRPEVTPPPADEVAWDQWFDDRGRQITEWLARPETWAWSDEQLADWLEVQVFRNAGEPYRWVQFGPVRRAAGTMRPSHYWIQWRDQQGVVRSQALDPMDSGVFEGHRIFVTEDGRRVLVALLRSVIAPNSASVWVWELDGDQWRPLADAFAGTGGREVLPGLFVDEEGTGGFRASQVWDSPWSPPPYVGFRETLTVPHFVLCAVTDLGFIPDCNKVVWTGDRFQLESKESWGKAVRPMQCAQLTLAGEPDLWSGDPDWALSRFGTPAHRTVDGHRADWQYPERGLTVTFWGGSVAQVVITQGGLSSGLQVGDSLARAIQLHGRPAERPDGELVWSYEACLLELVAKVSEGRITALRLLTTQLE